MNKNKDIYYRWREPYGVNWYKTRCKVLEHNNKTAKIELLEFGKNQARPGTTMQVHLKSLIGFTLSDNKNADLGWHDYTYFD